MADKVHPADKVYPAGMRIDFDRLPIAGIAADEVHVWFVDLNSTPVQIETFYSWLAQDEIRRSDGYHFERDRRWYIARRGLLRRLLAYYLGLQAGEVRFTLNRNGKPGLTQDAAGSGGLQFSLSHSNGWALYAFTQNRAVGVDFEQLPQDGDQPLDFDPLALAERFFSARELASLQAMSDQDRLIGFFSGWTRKEALIKGIGKGLSDGLKQFEVSLIAGEEARLLATPGRSEPSLQWCLFNLDLGSGYAAALALEGNQPAAIKSWSVSV